MSTGMIASAYLILATALLVWLIGGAVIRHARQDINQWRRARQERRRGFDVVPPS